MRILQLRFKNLNSLLGEWSVDLSHPAYAADGIFAITGPTGAGKSTLLDAICLALYGRTPRLSRISKSSNEILSRQAGECYAEVTFETQSGRYRCHWSQHRARRRPDGDLQHPRHEISDADSGEVLQAQLRGVAELVETVTGMDFDRFTRSVLLAQGGFAAFLQATPDERSPLLEQITGTEIYSRISMRVHERRAEARTTLDTLQAALDGMVLLSEAEEGALAQRLAGLEQQDAALSGELTRHASAVQWRETLDRLEDAWLILVDERLALQVRLDASAPQRDQLAAAHRALELAAEDASLQAQRQALDADRQASDAANAALPAAREAMTQAETAQQAAARRVQACRDEWTAAQPALQQVRALDLRIAEREAPLRQAEQAVAAQGDVLAAQQAQREHTRRLREQSFQALQAVQARLGETAQDARLVGELAALQARFRALSQMQHQWRDAQAAQQQAALQCATASEAWRRAVAAQDQALRAQAQAQQGREAVERRLRQALDGRTAAQWRAEQAHLRQRQALAAAAVQAVQDWMAAQHGSAAIRERQSHLQAELSALQQAQASAGGEQRALEQQQELLEQQWRLQQRIQDLESARTQLQPDAPCPLCGSTSHPYAQGQMPVADDTQQRLQRLRGDLKSVGQRLLAQSAAQARAEGALAQAGRDLRDHAEQAAQAREALAQAIAGLVTDSGMRSDAATDWLSEAGQRQLHDLLAQAEAQSARADAVLAQVAQIEQEQQASQEALERLRTQAADAERLAREQQYQQQRLAEQQANLAAQADALHGQVRQALSTLVEDVAPFQVGPLTLERLTPVVAQLTQRRDAWNDRQLQAQALERECGELALRLQHQDAQVTQAEASLAQQAAQRDALRLALAQLVEQRRELFGDRVVAHEDDRLAAQLRDAERNLEAARAHGESAGRHLAQLCARIDSLRQDMEQRQARIAVAAQAFAARCAQAGLVDEAGYRAARLAEDARNRLSSQLQALDRMQAELAVRERELQAQLQAQRGAALSDQPLDALRQTQQQLAETQRGLQLALGALQNRLAGNSALKRDQQARLQGIAAQRVETQRWEELHALIGSGDGKKYRNFAQGLTFEIMVGHANRQLQKMSDRYLLVRDAAEPLELNVIDNYQAGEVRSTKNLSGGESFLVSLALALGLSQMASRNVRVDSLFLDEGFGTLDEDALDTALETLGGLQQDGKLIGVISHVPALKERIGTQIQVIPVAGGRSRLQGPGCAQYT